MSEDRTILLYSKAECPLCDKAEALLARLAEPRGLMIAKVDIERDPALAEAHGERIPVAVLRGVELGWGRLNVATVEARIERALAAR